MRRTVVILGLVGACGLTGLRCGWGQDFDGKLGGAYRGTYGAEATGLFSPARSGGPTTARMRVARNGRSAVLRLSGTDTQSVSGSYSATIRFRPGGTCTTDALVPGIVTADGSGRWNGRRNGRQVTFNLKGKVGIIEISVRGALKIPGKRMQLELFGSPSGGGVTIPSSGSYKFSGRKR